MAGFINQRVLHVDLTTGKTQVETPPESFYRTYGGGSAMGLAYILKEMPTGSDPLGPENILTLFTGLPTGLAISGQSRLTVNARSPISGAIGDSQCGGFFPASFKGAGHPGAVAQAGLPLPA
jgi:aldehyde:ferredoxin oxidoreductase